ncbi:hypothetical protein RQP46_005612 [Phenoliferia psychrophenolica]
MPSLRTLALVGCALFIASSHAHSDDAFSLKRRLAPESNTHDAQVAALHEPWITERDIGDNFLLNPIMAGVGGLFNGKTIGNVVGSLTNGGKVETQGDIITNAVTMVTGLLGRIIGFLATGGPIANIGSQGPLQFLFGGTGGNLGLTGANGIIGDLEGRPGATGLQKPQKRSPAASYTASFDRLTGALDKLKQAILDKELKPAPKTATATAAWKSPFNSWKRQAGKDYQGILGGNSDPISTVISLVADIITSLIGTVIGGGLSDGTNHGIGGLLAPLGVLGKFIGLGRRSVLADAQINAINGLEKMIEELKNALNVHHAAGHS